MTDLTIKRAEAIDVKPNSKYAVILRVLEGYEIDAEGTAAVVAEVEDVFESLGCARANVKVAIMQGLEIVGVTETEAQE